MPNSVNFDIDQFYFDQFYSDQFDLDQFIFINFTLIKQKHVYGSPSKQNNESGLNYQIDDE